MKVPLNKESQRQAALENHKANEAIHALVIKIISWKTGILEGSAVGSDDKISLSEWEKYKQHLLSISKSEREKVVLGKLSLIHDAIESHGGFK